VSYQNTIQKPKNPTQGHITSCHKCVRYATKTSIMPQRHQVMPHHFMPRRHQLCHKGIKLCHEDIKLCHEDIKLP